jgi:hypothetical protein
VLAAEHLLGLAGIDLRGELVEGAGEILEYRLPRFGPFREDRQVVDTGLERGTKVQILFEPSPPL